MSGRRLSNLVSVDCFVVRTSPIEGTGVFAITDISKGQKIGFFEGNEIDHDTQYSYELDNVLIEPTGDLRYLNHSCDANAHFEGRWLVTDVDIKFDDEITIDYLIDNKMVYFHFVCKCGAKSCKVKI